MKLLVVAAAQRARLIFVDIEGAGDESVDQFGRRVDHSADCGPRISGENEDVYVG